VDSAFAKDMSWTADIDWSETSDANKTLHLTAIPLCFITAGELGRYALDKIREVRFYCLLGG
jgi:hypothetical protein